MFLEPKFESLKKSHENSSYWDCKIIIIKSLIDWIKIESLI